jgi:hypothetical protein
MRTFARRLRRLEEQFGPIAESGEMRQVRTRLEAARLRCGLPQKSPERLAELRTMGVAEILKSARRRAALGGEPHLRNTAPEIDEAIPPLRPNPLSRSCGP